MQKDFHYFAIAVLCRAAGFNPADALTIAYASQYVDNATESELIRIDIGGGYLKFDPVCTCYQGLDAVASLAWSAQKRVWIPFHFLPARPFDPLAPNFSFITRPGSPFTELLIDQACKEPLEENTRRLCRIGVALHAYADSWAHQDFSGRKEHGENDVEEISTYHRETRRWDHPLAENLLFDILPQIGHAEAGHFPDLSYQKWRFYLCTPERRQIERDNVELFIHAARSIYHKLVPVDKISPSPLVPWNVLEPQLRTLFADPGKKPTTLDRSNLRAYRSYQEKNLDLRCQAWQKTFGDWFSSAGELYAYDHSTWRREALEGDVDWDGYSERDWYQMLPLRSRPNFWNSRWVHFHRAALRQRHFVLENLP
ncbi:MAG TPA: hypothetical protein PKM21_12710 [Anaerolineales bacterium]|nr:hypothetical protein [Anaerolineales bacterium]